MQLNNGWPGLTLLGVILFIGIATVCVAIVWPFPYLLPGWARWFMLSAGTTLLFFFVVALFGDALALVDLGRMALATLFAERASRVDRSQGNVCSGSVQLARLHYVLHDPGSPTAFTAFLDHPVLTTQGNHFQRHGSPAQMIEEAVFELAQALERDSGGRITCHVNVKQGSLAITLTIFTAYEFIAQYHDFVESISLLRRQLQELFQRTSSWYRTATGRDMQVQTDVSVAAPPRADDKKSGAKGGHGDASIATGNIVPPSGNDVRINVHVFSLANTPLGCLFLAATLFLVFTLLVGFVCLSDGQLDVCRSAGQALVERLLRGMTR